MSDIRNPKVIHVKGALFVLIGSLASALLVLEHPTVKVALLLGVAVWAFARAYYYAFYVIEHYVDDGYKFSGLLSFARYALRRGKVRRLVPTEDDPSPPGRES